MLYCVDLIFCVNWGRDIFITGIVLSQTSYIILEILSQSHWAGKMTEWRGGNATEGIRVELSTRAEGVCTTAGGWIKLDLGREWMEGWEMGTTAMGREYCYRQVREQQRRTFSSNNKWRRECYLTPAFSFLPSFLLCPHTMANGITNKNNTVSALNVFINFCKNEWRGLYRHEERNLTMTTTALFWTHV